MAYSLDSNQIIVMSLEIAAKFYKPRVQILFRRCLTWLTEFLNDRNPCNMVQTNQKVRISWTRQNQHATNGTLLECTVEKLNYRIERATGVWCRTPVQKRVYCRHWRRPHATFIQQFVFSRTLPESYRSLSDILGQTDKFFALQSIWFVL